MALDRKVLAKREKRFANNREFLLDPEGFEMPFPSSSETQPMHVKELFKYLQNAVTAGDLVAL